MLKITALYLDHEKELSGTDQVPLVSWKLESDRRNVKQSAYRVELSDRPDCCALLFDSGEIHSEEFCRIPDTVQLTSHTRYYVRVRVLDDQKQEAEAQTSFVTGIMEQEEWQGCFISAEKEEDASISKGTLVRNVFEAKGRLREAFVSCTALGVYELYINGSKVGKGEMTPGWTSYHHHLCYQTYEVTELLREGINGIGAMLGAGWYKGYVGFDQHVILRNHYGRQTAFLAQLTLRYEDGREEKFCTDLNWEGQDAPVVFSEIYHGETYDAAREIPGWSDGRKGSWRSVEKIPYDLSVLEAQPAVLVQQETEFPAVSVFETPAGEKVVDFGQNLSGRIRVQAKGKPGDEIRLECFEVLDAVGNVYTKNLRHARATMIYRFAREEEITYTPHFTFMGFRYARIRSFPGEAKAENFTSVCLTSRMEQTGSFESSDPKLNQLGHNILWGQKSNFLDIPTDCPQRDERMGWTGDAEIFCRTASTLTNTWQFYRKWLKDLAIDQIPDGGVTHVVPDIMYRNMRPTSMWYTGTYGGAAWGDAATIIPWTVYQIFRDIRILEAQYHSMQEWIRFMLEHSRNLIWNFGVQLADWVALDAAEGSYFGATPDTLITTAYFALSTRITAKTAALLGKDADAARYSDLYSRIEEKFHQTFFDKNGEMTAQTQTAHVVALYFGLCPEQYREQTIRGLLKLLKKRDHHMDTGFIGTPYLCHALSQNGHIEEAYELLFKEDFPSWLYEVNQGATTVWEHWDGMKPDGSMWSPDMNSFNHYAYGAIFEWIFRVAAGIEWDEEDPGYHHCVLYPRPGKQLRCMKGRYESIYGTIGTRWETDGDRVTLEIQLPPCVSAQICLDQAEEVLEADGLNFEEKNGLVSAAAGSGSYRIVYRRRR